jgi:hypothetical protein
MSATTIVLALAMVGGPASAAVDEAAPVGSREAFLEALGRVPDTAEVRGSLLSYLDQEAILAARPGAARPTTTAEALDLVEMDDPAGALWLGALMGTASGDMELLQLLPQAGDWPERLGFDLLDIGRHLTFGVPPADGSVLVGHFDPDAIAAAFAERGYSASEAGQGLLLCGAAGCAEGMAMDLANADGSLPFGGRLGRSEPLAVSEGAILSSADIATVEAMMAAAAGEVPSLADDPTYRALALAADPALQLIQATILPGGMLGIGPDIGQVLGAAPEEAAQLRVELNESLEPMPPAQAVAIIDGASATEQVVTLALSYADEEDAQVAAAVLPRRLASLPAVSFDTPMAELLEERGVTSVTGSSQPAGEGSTAIARIELRAALPIDDGPGTDRAGPSSQLYRLFADLVMRRDLLWLVPVLPLE